MENFCPNCGYDLLKKSSPIQEKLFVITKHLNVRSEPVVKEENKIGLLSYGDEILSLAENNGWLKINFQNQEAWISAEYLNKTIDKPINKVNFIVGLPNNYNDEITKKVREIINDEFGGGTHKWPLQCTEYTQYKIISNGRKIDWPVDRPRNGGRWAEIFQKQGKYEVSSSPVVGSAMSFTILGGYGHIAFVEDVLPNGSIKISEANWPGDGKYNERVINKILQEKYGAKFINFSKLI